MALAKQKIGHALSHAEHRNRAKRGLYHLFGRWSKIEKTFSESVQPITLPPPIEPSAVQQEALGLANAVVNELELKGATDLSNWAASITRLIKRGKSIEQIREVFSFLRKGLGDDSMRTFGTAKFEKYFEATEVAMKKKEAA